MTAKILQLHPHAPVWHFLRLGHTGYRFLEDSHASGRLAIERFLPLGAPSRCWDVAIQGVAPAGGKI